MSVDIEVYQNAKNSYLRIRKNMAGLSDMLRVVSTALREEPGRLIFNNVSSGLPPEVSLLRDSISVNANDWKSAQQITEMLADYHRARDSVRDAWTALPPDARSDLQPPPEGVLPDEGSGRRW